ncbi:MAG TPA: DUF2849 domain-containing protein [Rhodospirillaceae bacterium]|nr:hypothetical protein [Rhodospirillaceae bacterium]HAT34651.1 DUF2849 domain-containing protein [Rhodospirillaceae bacterium]|tara:strand:- start:116 stop:415 length:300 start_codon:yes stop_codon:yes gene_type:complete
MPSQVITANRLVDGDVVYLTASEEWSEWLADATISETDEDTARLLEIAEQAVEDLKVISPYEFNVTIDGKAIEPLSMREVIRAAGPTVRADLGKQASDR